MGNIPIHSNPNVHSRPYTDKSSHSSQQHITSATALIYASNAVILGMQPG
jgi:hypothetical protein